MNIKELREIIEIFENSEICELELERQGVKIRLKKNSLGVPVAEIAEDSPAAGMPRQGDSGAGTQGAEPEAGIIEIRAPMVGTFYRMPSPESGPFVEEGDEIGEGDVLCIIEAMKLMNEIKSDIKGRIKKVLVENGQAVEFNEPLFLIEAG